MNRLFTRSTFFAAALLAGMTLSGCGGKVDMDHFNQVQTGMTEDAVTNILGKPSNSTTQAALGMSGTVDTWNDGNKQITVTFANGKVLSKASNNL